MPISLVKIRSVKAEILFLLMFFFVEAVVVDPKNLPLKFGNNWISSIAEIILLFLLPMMLLLLLISI